MARGRAGARRRTRSPVRRDRSCQGAVTDHHSVDVEIMVDSRTHGPSGAAVDSAARRRVCCSLVWPGWSRGSPPDPGVGRGVTYQVTVDSNPAQGLSSDATAPVSVTPGLVAGASTVVRPIPVGNRPDAVSSDGIHVWVANQSGDTVSEIGSSTGTGAQTIPLDESAGRLSRASTFRLSTPSPEKWGVVGRRRSPSPRSLGFRS